MYTVYKTVNLVNGKFYIGVHKTDNPNDDYLGSGKLIKNAIKKYGIASFKKYILAIFDNKESAYQLEYELVTIGEQSYNLKAGGEGGFDYLNDGSYAHIERAKRGASIGGTKSSQMLWDKFYSDDKFKEDFSNKLSNSIKAYYDNGGLHSKSFLGKSHTDNTRHKMSEKAKLRTGSKNPQYGTMWITDGYINKKIKSTDIIPDGFYKGRVTKQGS